MLTVSTTHTLPAFWNAAFAAVEPSHLFLWAEGPGDTGQYTYKRLLAEGHCLSAYAMDKGLRPGDVVVVVADNHPVVFSVEYGLQLMGLENLTLPSDITPEQLHDWLHRISPKLAILTSYRVYDDARDVWNEWAASGHQIICYTRPKDQLYASDMIVTFEAAITRGKDVWRQRRAALRAITDSLSPEATCAHFVDDLEAGTMRGVTHRDLLSNLAILADPLPGLPLEVKILPVCSPAQPLHRLMGIYLPLMSRRRVVFADDPLRPPNVPGSQRFIAVCLPAQLDQMAKDVERSFRYNHGLRGRFYTLSMALHRRVSQRRRNGEPVPLVQKQRYGWARRYVLRLLRRKYLSHLEVIVGLGPGELSGAVKSLLLATGTPYCPVNPLAEKAEQPENLRD